MFSNILSWLNFEQIISFFKNGEKIINREDIETEENFNLAKRMRKLASIHESGENDINWESLPYPIIVQVFSYLCDDDRVAAAQVCRKWNKCFKSPSLWRKRKFRIGGPEGDITSHDFISFTSIFGSCLRDIEIEGWYGTEIFARTLIKLLENMKNARLQNFTLKRLLLDGYFCFHPELKVSVIRSINNMFHIQTELKKVTLENCEFDLATGTEVMEHLAASTGRELQYLDLKDSFDLYLRVHDFQPFQQAMKAFTNLSHISIDYSYISDELLLYWSVSLRHKLRTMDVTTYSHQTHVISIETWRKLSNSCPKLRVFISVLTLSNANDTIRLLKPTVPLHAFRMRSHIHSAQENQLSVLLKYLVDCFQHRLEKVTFEFEKMQDSVDSELIYLLERCRLLESFCVTAKTGDRVIHTICDLLRDSQSVLRTVKISSCGGNNIPEIQDTLRLIHDIMPED